MTRSGACVFRSALRVGAARRDRRAASSARAFLSARRPVANPAISSSVRCSRSLARRARRRASISPKILLPVGVGPTITTRRSVPPCRRSTRPRCSMRLTMPVALATETSSASASWPIDIWPCISSSAMTLRWTSVSAPSGPRCQRLMAVIHSRGFQAVSSLSRSSASRSRRCRHRPGALPGVDIQWHMNNLAHL